jgi:hypothetical protein
MQHLRYLDELFDSELLIFRLDIRLDISSRRYVGKRIENLYTLAIQHLTAVRRLTPLVSLRLFFNTLASGQFRKKNIQSWVL